MELIWTTVRFVQNFYDRNNVDEPTSISTPILTENKVELFHDQIKSTIHILSDYTFNKASLFNLQGVEISSPSFIGILKLQTNAGEVFTQKLIKA